MPGMARLKILSEFGIECCTYVYLCCTYVYTYVVPLCTPMLYLCARPCCNYVYLCVHEADKVNIFQIIFDLRRN